VPTFLFSLSTNSLTACISLGERLSKVVLWLVN
jgi:hypothetical protein